jgi:hypothetical protein
MTFARWLFRVAGIYGLIVLVPQYFMEGQIGRDYPPPITHPEHFYGFVGVAAAWQIVFLVIAQDPARYRSIMPVAALAKTTFGIAAVVLFALQRLAALVMMFALIDLALAALFLLAWWRLAPTDEAGGVDGGK